MLRALSATIGFLSIDDLANNQGELVITIENDSEHDTLYIEACVQLPENATRNDIAAAYISLCSDDSPAFDSFFTQSQSDTMPRSCNATARRSSTTCTTSSGQGKNELGLGTQSDGEKIGSVSYRSI